MVAWVRMVPGTACAGSLHLAEHGQANEHPRVYDRRVEKLSELAREVRLDVRAAHVGERDFTDCCEHERGTDAHRERVAQLRLALDVQENAVADLHGVVGGLCRQRGGETRQRERYHHEVAHLGRVHSTVTLFARLRGRSTSQPRITAM